MAPAWHRIPPQTRGFGGPSPSISMTTLTRTADEFRWFVAQDREPPGGMAALRQPRLPLHPRDPARPLLVPALARGWAAATAIRFTRAAERHAGSHRAAPATASARMGPTTGARRAPSTN